MLLLAPLVLAAPLLLLAQAVVLLCARGPLGVAAAAGLLVGVAWSSRWVLRRARAWWAGTKAPVRAPTAAGTGRAPAAPPARSAGRSPGSSRRI